MNKWLGSGKVSQDPTIKYNEDKVSFVAFTMMCKRNRKIREGDQAVDFIDCICFGTNAELAKNYLRKGKKVEVCGPIQSGTEKLSLITFVPHIRTVIFAQKRNGRALKPSEKRPARLTF